jgi:leucyl/phenylalanyl-tRNA--protein transferase
MRLADVRIPRRFRRTMRTCGFTVAFDTAFAEVVRACAAPRKSFHLTWLYPSTQKLLCDLHDAGFAHSVEVRDEGGELVGGVFGIMVGPVFSALSMFHTRNDASKLALIALYRQLAACGVHTVDHMVLSPWVADLGGVDITRDEMLALLRGPDPECAKPGRWSAVATTTDIAEWQPLAAAESGDEEPVRAVAARG